MDARAAKIDLLNRIHQLESEVRESVGQRPREQATPRNLLSYIRHSRVGAFVSAPVIYACLIPFWLLDGCLRIYEAICFPIYGIPKVKRSRYLIYDRSRLPYLNVLEKLHCHYCSYANGLCAYASEIVARTEQHWCPIEHATPPPTPHSRYEKFLEFGDADAYAQRVEQVRRDFEDLKKLDR